MERKEFILAKLQELNDQEATGVSLQQKELIDQTRKSLQEELAEIEARDSAIEQVKEIKHEEISGLILGYNFNDIFQNPEANKIIHTLLYEESLKYEGQLLDKDAKIKVLTKQSLEAENQIDSVKQKCESLQNDLADALERNSEVVESYNQATDENNTLKADIVKLSTQIADLEAKLEQAQKAKEFKPSESLAQLVENAKKASDSLESKINRGLDRWAQMLPEIVKPPEPTVSPFPPSYPADGGSNTPDNDTAQTDIPEQVGEYFRDGSTVAEGSSSVGRETATETVTRAEFEKRVGQLEVYVQQLNEHAGFLPDPNNREVA